MAITFFLGELPTECSSPTTGVAGISLRAGPLTGPGGGGGSGPRDWGRMLYRGTVLCFP